MIYKKKRGNLQPRPSSIILDLKPILAARNIIHPTAYLIKLGLNNRTVFNMLNDKAVQLNFNQITLLCVNLNCTPNDILSLREMTLPPNHALNKLKQHDSRLPSIAQWLADKSFDEVQEILKG